MDAELTGARSGAKAQQKLAEELKLRLETKENEQKEQEQQQEQLVLVLERECEDAKSKVLHLNTELLNSERAVEAERQRSLGLERSNTAEVMKPIETSFKDVIYRISYHINLLELTNSYIQKKTSMTYN